MALPLLDKAILRDKYNNTIFARRKEREIYLVGGYVRDILRGVTSSDRDFIVFEDLQSFVTEVGAIIGGTIVQFKNDNLIRIVTKEGITLDFSSPMGTLEYDLSKRDFTINAIAWSPRQGIIDYHHGLEDIEKNRVCAISEENMKSDPLRMLRAYRFAAELNAHIERRTRNIIKTLHGSLNKVSPERITSEIFHLLNSKQSAKYLKMALTDGILREILPFPFIRLEENIREIYKVERGTLRTVPQRFKVFLDKLFTQNLTRKGLLCLVLLLKYTNSSPGVAQHLKISNKIVKHIKLAHEGIRIYGTRRKITGAILFDIFHVSRGAAIDVLLLKNRSDLITEHEKFEKIWKRGVLTSPEIIAISNLEPGPAIRQVIEQLRKAQFEGRVKTRTESIELVLSSSCLKTACK